MALALLAIVALVAVSVLLLKQFDKVAGRGAKQVADGIKQSQGERIECPKCAEMIKPNAKICPHCKSSLE